MPRKCLEISLNEWDTRLIIEALKHLESEWRQINETCTNEDLQAEYGNDLMALANTSDRVIKAAESVFGPSISTLDRTPL